MVFMPIKESFTLCVLCQDNKGGDPYLLPTGEIKPRHQIRSNGLEVRKLKVSGNPRSMDDVIRWTKALDESLGSVMLDPKWDTCDLWSKYQIWVQGTSNRWRYLLPWETWPMQGGKGQDWGYLVSMDRLERRYDNVKVPESLGKS